MTDGIWITELETPDGDRRLAVKDLFDTAGARTTYGSAVFADHVPSTSAEAVRRLEAAGWLVAGKTNLHEFAYGTTSQNVHYGTVPNPLAPGRIAGGSSGGSAAALAAGLADGALGTDTGGSIRIPAACCGVVGFKPTFGLVPIDGVFPLAPSFDHAGPMARSVERCCELMTALVPGFDVLPLASLEELTVGVAWTEHAEPAVRARVEAAVTRFPRRRTIQVALCEEVRPAFMREVGDVHRDLYPEHAELYGENVREKFELCLEVSDREYEEALRSRDLYRQRADEALGSCDLLVTPTLVCPPTPADVPERDLRGALTRLTFPLNALGWPALALPCGMVGDGLPVSLQIAGRPGQDARVLAAGLALERALKA